MNRGCGSCSSWYVLVLSSSQSKREELVKSEKGKGIIKEEEEAKSTCNYKLLKLMMPAILSRPSNCGVDLSGQM